MSMETGLSRATCNLCGVRVIVESKEEFFGCPMGWAHTRDTVEGDHGRLQYKTHVCANCMHVLNENTRKPGTITNIDLRFEPEKKGGE